MYSVSRVTLCMCLFLHLSFPCNFQMGDLERGVARQVSIVPKESTVLSFDDIRYTVQVKQNPCSKSHDKTIIDGVR